MVGGLVGWLDEWMLCNEWHIRFVLFSPLPLALEAIFYKPQPVHDISVQHRTLNV